MNDRKARMIEDRYLRDSAKALVEADLEHIKTDFAQRSLGERALDRVTDGAMDLYEEAVDLAEDNKGALAALAAAIVVWFVRNPILSLLGLGNGEEHEGWDETPENPER